VGKLMDAMSDFYMHYVRQNMFFMLLIVLAVATYRNREACKEFTVAYMSARGTPMELTGANPNFFRFCKAALVLFWQYAKWMLAFGIPATMLDMTLGPQI
jgi:hypothetical protein